MVEDFGDMIKSSDNLFSDRIHKSVNQHELGVKSEYLPSIKVQAKPTASNVTGGGSGQGETIFKLSAKKILPVSASVSPQVSQFAEEINVIRDDYEKMNKEDVVEVLEEEKS